MLAAENAARSTTSPTEAASEAMSRDQISQALSSKDASYFRQTPDRGAESNAYRRSQVEDEERTDMSSLRTQLPGMSREPSAEAIKDEDGPRHHDSPLPLTGSQKLDPPVFDNQHEPDAAQEKLPLTSPSLDRFSPTKADKPSSPTKGMGGFVQSAMMKRNESVNKRWSVQSPGGLQRVDPIAPGSKPRPTSMYREISTEALSRPSLIQGTDDGADGPGSSRATAPLNLDTDMVIPPPDVDADKSLPGTPSQGTDQRRWSPTKASWLESALNKPDTPKPKQVTAPANQPAWMAEIARAKAQKAANPNTDVARTPTVSHKHQVSIGGLMRSNPPGTTSIPASPLISQRTGGGGFASARNVFNTPTTDDTGPEAAPLVSQRTGGTGSVRGSGTMRERARSEAAPLIRQRTGGFTSTRNTTKDDAAAVDTATPAAESADAPSSSVQSPPSDTDKPETDAPVRKDFRASLKSRHAPSASESQVNNDFRNVFGALRKTTTQNYKAPDELKSNILRGKAALNVTGGPKKTERVDEFKEAILAKKSEFQKSQSEGRGVSRSNSIASEQPVPEGLVKSIELARAKSIKRESISSGPGALADVSKRSSGFANRDPKLSGAPTLRERARTLEMRASMPQASLVERGRGRLRPANDITPAARDDDTASASAAPKESGMSGRLQGKVGGGGVLANRFNPALAGLLARGPPSMASGTSDEASKSPGSEEPASGPKLTHMTKARARGPRRKAPTTGATALPSTAGDAEQTPAPLSARPLPSPFREEKDQDASRPVSRGSSRMAHEFQARPRPDPITTGSASKSFESASHRRSPSKVTEQIAAFAAQRNSPSPTKQRDNGEVVSSQPVSPRKLDMKRMSRFFDETSQGPKASTERRKSEVRSPSDGTQDMAPRPLFSNPSTPALEEPKPRSPPASTMADMTTHAPLPASPKPAGDFFSSRPLPVPPSHSRSSSRPLPYEPPVSPRPLPSPQVVSPGSTMSSMRSPTKQAIEVSDTLHEFFGPNRPKRDYRVDAAEILMNKPSTSAPQIQTLDAQLFQFSADGKRSPVRAGDERNLFEGEMYLCAHTFVNDAGRRASEVYFWSGNAVPASVVEDASTFVGREARAMGGKLVVLTQGKESAEFLAALGGIVVTQRGTRNKFDSLAPRMLCGRRFSGQIVFDEVEFTSASLCSGFPFLISTGGNCYLWKGKGSGADELGCARLVGMDYALTGELEEVDDGYEPANFWDLFEDGNAKAGSADHWRLKPSYEKYGSRLFASDTASKQQVGNAVLP